MIVILSRILSSLGGKFVGIFLSNNYQMNRNDLTYYRMNWLIILQYNFLFD